MRIFLPFRTHRSSVFQLLLPALVAMFSATCWVQSTFAQVQQTEQEQQEQLEPTENRSTEKDADGEWMPLFNGKDLTGWTPKIRGHELGDNYADTFRVVEGNLVVCYDDYVEDDFLSFDGQKKPTWEKFGHLFYKDEFSHYVLRAEYRFVGDQVKNGPGWAFRNNGFMLHGQDPKTMTLNQKFPVSIEVQLLGGPESGERPTLNLCTPGTNVVLDGKLSRAHCLKKGINKAPTFPGDQWVTVEIEVRGSDVVRHKVNGRVALEYTQPQYDPRDADAKKLITDENNLLIDHGTISIQSESHRTEFRKIEIKVLDDGQGKKQ
ncbi:MAG: DUF1080 domain-containing protein [Planctomycetota bacterium]